MNHNKTSLTAYQPLQLFLQSLEEVCELGTVHDISEGSVDELKFIIIQAMTGQLRYLLRLLRLSVNEDLAQFSISNILTDVVVLGTDDTLVFRQTETLDPRADLIVNGCQFRVRLAGGAHPGCCFINGVLLLSLVSDLPVHFEYLLEFIVLILQILHVTLLLGHLLAVLILLCVGLLHLQLQVSEEYILVEGVELVHVTHGGRVSEL